MKLEKPVRTGQPEQSFSRYRLIEAVVREQIVSGEYAAGDRLPTEAGLCEMFGASRPTVRQALGALEADGLISREHGRGSFVRRGAEALPPDRFELSFDDLIESPRSIKIVIQRSGSIKGHGIAHSALNLSRGAEVFYFVQVYFLQKTAIGAAKVHVPSAVGAKLRTSDLSARNVPQTIAARAGKALGSWALAFDSTLAEPRYAEIVGARAGGPLTSVRRTSYASDKTAIEHTQLLLRPEICRLVERRGS